MRSVVYPALLAGCSLLGIISNAAKAQCFAGAANHTTSAVGTTDWSTPTNWTGGAGAPGCDISAQNRKVAVQRDMTVSSGACPALTFSGESTALQVTNNSTLTIEGDFNASGERVCIYVEAGSSIIVLGDLFVGNEFVNFIVEGTFTISGTIQCTGQCEPGSTSFSGGGTMTAGGDCTGDFGPECDNFLPIELIYFNASKVENCAVLDWATSMEENFREFVVQRSANGTDFEEIGRVAGKGFNISGIESKYSFTDSHPLRGNNYYRLKAVDLDDQFEYFGVKVVKIVAPRYLTVYPNPSSGGAISFRTNFNPTESARVTIVNQLGVEIFRGTATASEVNIPFDGRLPAGIYFLRYVSEDFEQTARVVVPN